MRNRFLKVVMTVAVSAVLMLGAAFGSAGAANVAPAAVGAQAAVQAPACVNYNGWHPGFWTFEWRQQAWHWTWWGNRWQWIWHRGGWVNHFYPGWHGWGCT